LSVNICNIGHSLHGTLRDRGLFQLPDYDTVLFKKSVIVWSLYYWFLFVYVKAYILLLC